MSQENVEVVRAWYEAINRWLDAHWANPGGPLGEAPGLEEIFDHMASEAEWDWLFSADILRGRDQMLGAAIDFVETVDAWRLEIEELTAGTDGQVLVELRVVARGRGSGVPVDQRMFPVVTVRGGKVARVKDYVTRAEALEAAGLRE
jgi:ketosteroid isomerase-like protein